MATVVGYIRISKDEKAKKNGVSLGAQRAAILAEAQRRGWEVVAIIEDDGYSARNLNRPGIERVFTLIDEGIADTLMVSRVDRLSRSLLDFASLMELSRRRAWYIVALDLNVDTTTPHGELMANVLAMFAHYERRLIGQRTKDALAVKKAQGIRLGRPVGLPKEVAERIVEERASGMTLRSIAEVLNRDEIPTAQGGQRWHASTVASVLKRLDG